jgi:hypothetical protein
VGLWTVLSGLARVRTASPSTYGALAIAYEDLDRIHVRLSGTLSYKRQDILGQGEHSIQAHGFAEYSWRASPDFFMLPRLGYDGYYSSVARRPFDVTYLDDDVYNWFRAKRPTFVFAQALLWYAPFFDDIFYLRSRISADPGARLISHVGVRPGLFAAFGQLDVTAFVDNAWYAATESLTNKARIEVEAGARVFYNQWWGMGSLNLQPGAAMFWRPTDGGWQVNAFVNLLASYRRGLRDSSSLDLDFPEQLGGGIPWRGDTPGGYR